MLLVIGADEKRQSRVSGEGWSSRHTVGRGRPWLSAWDVEASRRSFRCWHKARRTAEAAPRIDAGKPQLLSVTFINTANETYN